MIEFGISNNHKDEGEGPLCFSMFIFVGIQGSVSLILFNISKCNSISDLKLDESKVYKP